MMKKEALERQSTPYLLKLEVWELIRWKRRLKLLNETTYNLWSIKEVLREREPHPIWLKGKMKKEAIKFPKDEDAGIINRDIVYREDAGIVTRDIVYRIGTYIK